MVVRLRVQPDFTECVLVEWELPLMAKLQEWGRWF